MSIISECITQTNETHFDLVSLCVTQKASKHNKNDKFWITESKYTFLEVVFD